MADLRIDIEIFFLVVSCPVRGLNIVRDQEVGTLAKAEKEIKGWRRTIPERKLSSAAKQGSDGLSR